MIDTAGIRRKAKVNEDLEFYSVIRAIKAVDEADAGGVSRHSAAAALAGVALSHLQSAAYMCADECGRVLTCADDTWCCCCTRRGCITSSTKRLS